MRQDQFESISLEQMDQVKLMNRTDRKFWFNAKYLPEIFQAIHDNYYILEINGESNLKYSTTYYDTSGNNIYTTHHNGKLNRYKIRRRTYVDSQISFLEVKFKSNKGRTIKKRIKGEMHSSTFSPREAEFISDNTPYSVDDLNPALTNEFQRITLVNKNFNERCTIDQNLNYAFANKNETISNLCILEIKANGKTPSPLYFALRDQRIHAAGFSKYCIGRYITGTDIKRNAFKKKIRRIEKIISTNAG